MTETGTAAESVYFSHDLCGFSLVEFLVEEQLPEGFCVELSEVHEWLSLLDELTVGAFHTAHAADSVAAHASTAIETGVAHAAHRVAAIELVIVPATASASAVTHASTHASVEIAIEVVVIVPLVATSAAAVVIAATALFVTEVVHGAASLPADVAVVSAWREPVIVVVAHVVHCGHTEIFLRATKVTTEVVVSELLARRASLGAALEATLEVGLLVERGELLLLLLKGSAVGRLRVAIIAAQSALHASSVHETLLRVDLARGHLGKFAIDD